MSIIRTISAILFALVLLAIAYGAFWFSAFRYAESVLSDLAMRRMGVTATFNAPQWLPDPSRVAVRLPKVEARFVPAGTSVSVVASLAEINLFSGFFDNGQHMIVKLPQSFELVVSVNGSSKSFTVVTSRGEIAFLGDQLRMTAATFRLIDAQGRELLVLQDGIFNQKSDTIVRVMAKNIDGVAGKIDDFVLEMTLKAMPDVLSGVWRVLYGGRQLDIQNWIGTIGSMLKRGGVIDVSQLLFRRGEVEGSLFGQISSDSAGYPNSELTLMSSSADVSKGWIGRSGLIRSTNLEEEMRLKQVLKKLEPDQPVANMVFHQGLLILNTQRVGKVAPLLDIVNGLIR